jgi:LPXTG-motif cell wall-anchored protein
VNRTSHTRRLFAGVAGLMVGGAAALAFAAPASAQDDVQPFGYPVNKDVVVTGEAVCDVEAETWTVTWTVTNTSPDLQATVTALSSENVDGIALNDVVPAADSVTGTETFPSGTESATLEVELKWSWKIWHIWKTKTKSNSATVELGDCKTEEPPPPPPEEPPVGPALIAFVTCDLLGFIIDNTEGEAEAVVTLTPNEPATNGHATGFSYEVGEDGTITIIEDEGAGITEVVAEDSDEPVVLGPFVAGAASHTHAFEAFEGLEVTIDLTLDGELVELEDNVVSWDDEIEAGGVECQGEGGELPTTGNTTMLIAGGAVALLALGGGLFLVARRRRVTFTA